MSISSLVLAKLPSATEMPHFFPSAPWQEALQSDQTLQALSSQSLQGRKFITDKSMVSSGEIYDYIIVVNSG